MSLEDAERLLIKKALARFEGNANRAAEASASAAAPCTGACKSMGYHKPVSTPPSHRSIFPQFLISIPLYAIVTSNLKAAWRCWRSGWISASRSALFYGWMDIRVGSNGLSICCSVFLAGNLGEPENRVVRPLQTLSNILAAIRKAIIQFAAAAPPSGDALGEVMLEVNDLGANTSRPKIGRDGRTAAAYRDVRDRCGRFCV
jgi:hypothetical protein